MKSVIQKQKMCLVCNTPYNLHEHHIFEGTANRRMSEKFGLKVFLCARHHNMSNEGVHFNKELDLSIKQLGQKYFERHYGSRDYFIEKFGKSYL